MDLVSFVLAAHSTFYKLKPSTSKDSGIFIDNSSYEHIKHFIDGTDSKGRETIKLVIYKEDCITAIDNIVRSLPLFTSKSGKCRIEDCSIDVRNDLFRRVSTFFRGDVTKLLTGLYFTNLQGRIYLWGTEGRNAVFELRRFFIADHTILSFNTENDKLTLRFKTNTVI